MCGYVSVLSFLGDVLIVRKWQINKTALPKFWYRTLSIDLLTPASSAWSPAGWPADRLTLILTLQCGSPPLQAKDVRRDSIVWTTSGLNCPDTYCSSSSCVVHLSIAGWFVPSGVSLSLDEPG